MARRSSAAGDRGGRRGAAASISRPARRIPRLPKMLARGWPRAVPHAAAHGSRGTRTGGEARGNVVRMTLSAGARESKTSASCSPPSTTPPAARPRSGCRPTRRPLPPLAVARQPSPRRPPTVAPRRRSPRHGDHARRTGTSRRGARAHAAPGSSWDPRRPAAAALETLLRFLAARRLAILQTALEVEHAASELAERYEEINLLYTISEILGRTVALEEAARTILHEISETVGARPGLDPRARRASPTRCRVVAALGARAGDAAADRGRRRVQRVGPRLPDACTPDRRRRTRCACRRPRPYRRGADALRADHVDAAATAASRSAS